MSTAAHEEHLTLHLERGPHLPRPSARVCGVKKSAVFSVCVLNMCAVPGRREPCKIVTDHKQLRAMHVPEAPRATLTQR